MDRREAADVHGSIRHRLPAGLIAGSGAAIAIGGMEWLAAASHYALVFIPFATSIVLIIGSPQAEPAQPRANRRASRCHAGGPCGASAALLVTAVRTAWRSRHDPAS